MYSKLMKIIKMNNKIKSISFLWTDIIGFIIFNEIKYKKNEIMMNLFKISIIL